MQSEDKVTEGINFVNPYLEDQQAELHFVPSLEDQACEMGGHRFVNPYTQYGDNNNNMLEVVEVEHLSDDDEALGLLQRVQPSAPSESQYAPLLTGDPQIFITEDGRILKTQPINTPQGFRAQVLGRDGSWNAFDSLPVKMSYISEDTEGLNRFDSSKGQSVYFVNAKALQKGSYFEALLNDGSQAQRVAILKHYGQALDQAASEVRERAHLRHYGFAAVEFNKDGVNTNPRSILLYLLNAWRDLYRITQKVMGRQFESVQTSSVTTDKDSAVYKTLEALRRNETPPLKPYLEERPPQGFFQDNAFPQTKTTEKHVLVTRDPEFQYAKTLLERSHELMKIIHGLIVVYCQQLSEELEKIQMPQLVAGWTGKKLSLVDLLTDKQKMQLDPQVLLCVTELTFLEKTCRLWMKYTNFALQQMSSRQFEGRDRCRFALEESKAFYFTAMRILEKLPKLPIPEHDRGSEFLQTALEDFTLPTRANIDWSMDEEDKRRDLRAIAEAISDLTLVCRQARVCDPVAIYKDWLSDIKRDLLIARASRLNWRASQPESPLIPWIQRQHPSIAAVIEKVLLPMNQLVVEHHGAGISSQKGQSPLDQVLHLVTRSLKVLSSPPLFWNGIEKSNHLEGAVQRVRDTMKVLEKRSENLGLSPEIREQAKQELRQLHQYNWPKLIFESGLWDAMAKRRTNPSRQTPTQCVKDLVTLLPSVDSYRCIWVSPEPLMPECVSSIVAISVAARSILRLLSSSYLSMKRVDRARRSIANRIQEAEEKFLKEQQVYLAKLKDGRVEAVDDAVIRLAGWQDVILKTGLWMAMRDHFESELKTDIGDVLNQIESYRRAWHLPAQIYLLDEPDYPPVNVIVKPKAPPHDGVTDVLKFVERSCRLMLRIIRPNGFLTDIRRDLVVPSQSTERYGQIQMVKAHEARAQKFQLSLKVGGVFETVPVGSISYTDLHHFVWFKLILEAPFWQLLSKGGAFECYEKSMSKAHREAFQTLFQDLADYAKRNGLTELFTYRSECRNQALKQEVEMVDMSRGPN